MVIYFLVDDFLFRDLESIYRNSANFGGSDNPYGVRIWGHPPREKRARPRGRNFLVGGIAVMDFSLFYPA